MAKAMTWRQATDVLTRCSGGAYQVGPEARAVYLVVPGRPLPVSNRTWGHWAAKAARVGVRRRLVAAAAASVRARLDLPPQNLPAQVSFTVFCTAPLPDYPNLAQNLKPDLDGLVDAGWLVDDNPQWLPQSPTYELVRVYQLVDQVVRVEVRMSELVGRSIGLPAGQGMIQ